MEKQAINFDLLKDELEGDLYTDQYYRVLYATDGSAYREIPVAVTRPASKEDLHRIIKFAGENNISIIPRGAGTSLAGQVVGPGIVVDVSKYLNHIIEFNPGERWVKVEPGVVLGELNNFLSKHRLMFGPETSTANRCCLGGMLGNNSCGLHSIIYGSVRDHILEVSAILSDGSEAVFSDLSSSEFIQKASAGDGTLENRIYKFISEKLSDAGIRREIISGFPDKAIRRRNHGYAIDELIDTDPFTGNGKNINLSKLLAGSEGTLAFTTSMKLNLIPVENKATGLVCAHFSDMNEALRANIRALKYNPAAIELIDNFIINCTKDNIEQAKNRFFIKGDPGVVLIIEFLEDSINIIDNKASDLAAELAAANLGYYYPLYADQADIRKIWELRKAGLGVLLNIPGDRRSVQVIEDTAVHPELYPEYFREVEAILDKYRLSCSYYGHIATGELHFSPLLDLRNKTDVEIYRKLAVEISALVKKYRGSLSGEHGDGRLRGEFIPFMLGEKNYSLLCELKSTWDPKAIFNPGKITSVPPITECLRYEGANSRKDIITTLSFNNKDFVSAIEKCSGSGDCRKSQAMGGTMCPTFMATGDEDKSTRGRANILRDYLTRSKSPDPFNQDEIYKVMDLCLSCKACKSECPSNIDMAAFKAEFLQHYYDSNGIPARSLMIAWLPRLNSIMFTLRPVVNFMTGSKLFRRLAGFSEKRTMPQLSRITLKGWMRKRKKPVTGNSGKGTVYLLTDEFTNYNESDIGIKAVLLLEKLGYEVRPAPVRESGRTYISKGLLRRASGISRKNTNKLTGLINSKSPLVGIEPSAILTFRDENPSLLKGDLKAKAESIAANTWMIEEFICIEADKGNISRDSFTDEKASIIFHGHCQQKSIASVTPSLKALSLPVNYTVSAIESGCCGMAGAFGYEKEHYDLSMNIGEMVLFPVIRSAGNDVLISAPGTSCRNQIADGTGRKAFHPAEILYAALRS